LIYQIQKSVAEHAPLRSTKFKLERIFDKALFLSPKMYSGKSKLSNGIIEQYTKIKGVKINVKFIDLIKL
jgi:hypothetical protein